MFTVKLTSGMCAKMSIRINIATAKTYNLFVKKYFRWQPLRKRLSVPLNIDNKEVQGFAID